jgi:two-component system sensor histidine kinase TctE
MEYSLKQQLLIWLIAPMLVIAPVAATFQYWLSLRPAKQEFDHQLGDFAIAVSSFLKVEDKSIHFKMTDQAEHLLRTDQIDTEFFLVVSPEGKVIAGDPLLNTPEDNVATGELRFIDREVNGRALRMVLYGVACGKNTCQVRVAETQRKRDRAQAQALMATLLSILVLGLTTTLVVLIAVKHGLKPIQDLRAQLNNRTFSDLKPISLPHAPFELQPLITTLNHLFKQLSDASNAQKAFLADAAHQLRTPLTTLQTESELALLEPHPESLNNTLERLNRSANRAAKLANQLLALARADPNNHDSTEFTQINLKDIGAEAANEWSSQAFSVGIDLGFQLLNAPVYGQSILLQELLSNLIHNTVEHAGRGTQVTVKTYILDQFSILEVEDDGPGIGSEERQKVLQRFSRGSQAKGFGSGLGLAIANDIAQIHGAKLILTTPTKGKGLLVRIIFRIESTNVG